MPTVRPLVLVPILLLARYVLATTTYYGQDQSSALATSGRTTVTQPPPMDPTPAGFAAALSAMPKPVPGFDDDAEDWDPMDDVAGEGGDYADDYSDADLISTHDVNAQRRFQRRYRDLYTRKLQNIIRNLGHLRPPKPKRRHPPRMRPVILLNQSPPPSRHCCPTYAHMPYPHYYPPYSDYHSSPPTIIIPPQSAVKASRERPSAPRIIYLKSGVRPSSNAYQPRTSSHVYAPPRPQPRPSQNPPFSTIYY
jgi:hypothetical protein